MPSYEVASIPFQSGYLLLPAGSGVILIPVVICFPSRNKFEGVNIQIAEDILRAQERHSQWVAQPVRFSLSAWGPGGCGQDQGLPFVFENAEVSSVLSIPGGNRDKKSKSSANVSRRSAHMAVSLPVRELQPGANGHRWKRSMCSIALILGLPSRLSLGRKGIYCICMKVPVGVVQPQTSLRLQWAVRAEPHLVPLRASHNCQGKEAAAMGPVLGLKAAFCKCRIQRNIPQVWGDMSKIWLLWWIYFFTLRKKKECFIFQSSIKFTEKLQKGWRIPIRPSSPKGSC